ncbi:MAG: hypothetical protein H7175_24725 [Burkholderiales bacterium]|nr:hypothetical protein [Anaerolineae bacterium]
MLHRFALIILLLATAACSAAPEPTATSAPEPTDAAPQITQAPIATDALLNIVGVTLPPPGTIALPPVTDDPNPNSLFSSVELIRTGGPGNTTLTIMLSGEGELTRNDEAQTINQQIVDQLDLLLDQTRFYDIQGVFTSNSAEPDIYRYSLTVSGPAGSRTITADDSLTPPELRALFEAVLALGTENSATSVEATAEATSETTA